jgi:hypothetical protein
MRPGRRPCAPTALLFRVGDDVELCDTAPPVRATVVAVQPGRGRASIRIAYRGPQGTEVRPLGNAGCPAPGDGSASPARIRVRRARQPRLRPARSLRGPPGPRAGPHQPGGRGDVGTARRPRGQTPPRRGQRLRLAPRGHRRRRPATRGVEMRGVVEHRCATVVDASPLR